MNIKEEMAVLEYATKHNCTVAAARVRMAQEAKKPADAGTTELPIETLEELAEESAE